MAPTANWLAFQQIRYWLRWPQPEFPRTSTGKVSAAAGAELGASNRSPAEGSAVVDPSDRLLEVLRRLGAARQEMTSSDRLAEDLHLDSLAMVQLQSTLETEFGLELEDAVWGQVRTVGDLRGFAVSTATRGRPGERQCNGKLDACNCGGDGWRSGKVTGNPKPKRESGLSALAVVAGCLLGARRLSRGSDASVVVAGAWPSHRAAQFPWRDRLC